VPSGCSTRQTQPPSPTIKKLHFLRLSMLTRAKVSVSPDHIALKRMRAIFARLHVRVRFKSQRLVGDPKHHVLDRPVSRDARPHLTRMVKHSGIRRTALAVSNRHLHASSELPPKGCCSVSPTRLSVACSRRSHVGSNKEKTLQVYAISLPHSGLSGAGGASCMRGSTIDRGLRAATSKVRGQSGSSANWDRIRRFVDCRCRSRQANHET
jgi:hypothetical protein